MNTDMDATGDLSQDMEVIRSLLQKYGGVKNMNTLMSLASLPGSTASICGQSFVSGSGTSMSRATTSSSFYPESMSTGRDSTEVQVTQWQPTSAPMSTGFPVTPIDPPLPIPALISEPGRDPETDASADDPTPRYQCPLCAEVGIDNRIKRKTDLKRHFNNIHAFDCQWVCKFQIGSGCGATFDFFAAYEDHVKREHNGFKDQDAKVNLCQQVVFACGFERCREVFEAPTDLDSRAVRAHYFDHILSHLSAGAQVHWSYRRRMRNLLRQSLVLATWKEYNRDMAESTWDPESSALLRKLLECRHIVDVALLCSYAVHVGSAGFAPPVPPLELTMPLLNECTLSNHCHEPRQDIRFSQGLTGFTMVPEQGLSSRRSRAVLRSSPSVQSRATFAPHPPTPTSGLCHELPPPSMTLASQHIDMDLNADAMDDTDDIILFHKHKPLEYFLGPKDNGPMDAQIGPHRETGGRTLPRGSRTSSRRHLLAKKSFEKLRAIRNAGDGDYRMMDWPPTTSVITLPQDQGPSEPHYMSGYEI